MLRAASGPPDLRLPQRQGVRWRYCYEVRQRSITASRRLSDHSRTADWMMSCSRAGFHGLGAVIDAEQDGVFSPQFGARQFCRLPCRRRLSWRFCCPWGDRLSCASSVCIWTGGGIISSFVIRHPKLYVGGAIGADSNSGTRGARRSYFAALTASSCFCSLAICFSSLEAPLSSCALAALFTAR
ncbi:MAG: hypothetical protein RL095_244 [Verrucomicrobiota bacterium]